MVSKRKVHHDEKTNVCIRYRFFVYIVKSPKLIKAMTTVTWVQDENGQYEISSKEHLKQLMNEGTLYTDAGTPPSDYWGSNYIQTADIDLLSDSTDITPIAFFKGTYDGAEYRISNYSYADPNFNTSNACTLFSGLFGRCSGTIKNMRLDGVWTIEGFGKHSGFLAGYIITADTEELSNIECDFALGSFMDTNSAGNFMNVGGVVGYCRPNQVTGVTLKGSVDFRYDTSLYTTYMGGVCGYIQANGGAKLLRNLATFPSGIFGLAAGGICGGTAATFVFSDFLNAMTGDIFGARAGGEVGGVIGHHREFLAPCSTYNMINAMTGNISSSYDNSSIGGVFGKHSSQDSCQYMINYMTGNITFTGTGTTSMGGLVGEAILETTSSISNSINAMNGSVANGLLGEVSSNSNLITNTVTNTDFGLSFTTETFGNGTPTGLLTSTEFTELPYAELVGTDGDGNSYDFEFVYGNLSGNSSYSDYTHLVLHRGDISTPYEVTYEKPENNVTVFLTYVNTQTQMVYPPSGITGTTTVLGVTVVVPSLLSVQVRSINIPVVMSAYDGATMYRLTIEGPTGGEVTKVSGTTILEHNLTGVVPETQYTVRMYGDTGSGYELLEETVVTTLINAAASYDVSDFMVDGVVTFGSLGADLDLVINDLLITGDVVSVSLPSNTSVKSSFIKNGETLSINDVESALIPFYSSSGSGQNINFILSDNVTTVPITFDETSESITVDSVTYSTGDSFILDGKKVTVYDT